MRASLLCEVRGYDYCERHSLAVHVNQYNVALGAKGAHALTYKCTQSGRVRCVAQVTVVGR